MELVRKQVQLIRENAVGVEAGRYVDFGEALEQGMVSLVSDITKSQIEAAKREEREKVYADLNAYGERVMSEAKAKEWDNLPPLNEEFAKKLIEGIKSLTNHN